VQKMIKRRLALLALEGVLLLTACGQTKGVSTLTTPPLQSTAQVIAPVEDKAEMPQKEEKAEGSADAPLPVERVDTPTDVEAEKNPAPTAPGEPATPASAPEDKPAPAPTPAPTQKPAEKQEEQPAPTPEPTPAPKPAASGDIYSIAEAIQAGNEYARAQYGVTIDTSMTAANSSFFPGTADSVAWLAENGGQAALTAAVKGNVDATFACLAAMDGAETVSAYARFNCTVRYDAASDEYIVVVLYG
jgi:outer membrane biosynthesis protein TonB